MYKTTIIEPRSSKDFTAYYDLRWRILRRPWQQPRGSEKDELENESIHVMAVLAGKIVGCGRVHFNSPTQAQIRYMAVEENFRQHGVGTEILQELEKRVIQKGAQEIILKAREKAVSLYLRQGYEIFDEGEVMFGEIAHFWMRKIIISHESQ